MTTLTREAVIRIVSEARARGLIPDLRGADLSWADLREADLHGADGAFGLGVTPSGPTDLRPLPSGTWQITVGCFKGTTDELRAVIAGDNWPSNCDEGERALRRPILSAHADQADAIAAYHPHLLDAAVRKWGDRWTTLTRKESPEATR